MPSRYHLAPSHPHVLPHTLDPGAKLSYTLHTPKRPARGYCSHTAKKSKGFTIFVDAKNHTKNYAAQLSKILISKHTSGKWAWKISTKCQENQE